ncbi:response regulator [Halovenus rubra]|uniref:Response regulator n=2 Tax=Halovenus rubra TaxID=869890 RepID=A0ACC7DZ34_9EURY|nr:response regulator [Halovenus rubra]
MGTILLVDDSTFMRSLYRVLLEQSALTIVGEASNGVEGVDAYKEHNPDVVVMNIRMPVLDGISVTEKIMAYDPDAAIVICSGNAQEEKIIEAKQAGAVDYITKPFQRDSFLQAVTAPVE